MPVSRRRFAGLCAGAAASAATSSGAVRNPEIVRAMESVTAAIPKAESDPERPVWHFRPPANWNNDPNGTIFYKGWHHLFYQHNPYGSVWGHMHWGHARSRDLVNWEHLPIALWPSLEKGEEHIYSGGAILAADGRPRIFYTSIGKRDPEQWMAIPADDDLIVWEKYPRNPILTLEAHGGRQVYDWRDPFPFRANGRTWMVCGGNGNNRRQGGGGQVQLYQALDGDLTRWKHVGAVFEDLNRETINIECPNLFQLGTKWVLLDSPHKPCEYFVGQMDWNRFRFVPETRGVLDPGSAYASNISYDDKGRTLLWLWGRTATDPEKGWNSCMVMPRILSAGSDGFLRQLPASEFETLRGEARTVPPAALAEKPLSPGGIAADCLELEADFSAESATTVGLRVRCPAGGGGTEIAFNPQGGVLSVGKVQKLIGRDRRVRLRVFLDKRVLEVYVNDGEAAVFTTVDAAPSDLGVEAFARGGAARLEHLRAWPLARARFSLEHFKV